LFYSRVKEAKPGNGNTIEIDVREVFLNQLTLAAGRGL
jgi:hypothetical protein